MDGSHLMVVAHKLADEDYFVDERRELVIIFVASDLLLTIQAQLELLVDIRVIIVDDDDVELIPRRHATSKRRAVQTALSLMVATVVSSRNESTSQHSALRFAEPVSSLTFFRYV